MNDEFISSINLLEDQKDAKKLIDLVNDEICATEEKAYIRAAINRILLQFPEVKETLKKSD